MKQSSKFQKDGNLERTEGPKDDTLCTAMKKMVLRIVHYLMKPIMEMRGRILGHKRSNF